MGGVNPDACGAIGFDRSTFHYKSRRTDQAAIEKRIKDICETQVRYGYRRVHVLLDRELWGVKVKKVYRIYRELWMQLRNKTPKRRVKAKLRDDRPEAVGPNDVWAMDFVQVNSPHFPRHLAASVSAAVRSRSVTASRS